MITLQRVDRTHAEQAQGVVIVIDVIRAFTVAGCAFAGGARALWLVRTVAEAMALRTYATDALLIGEVGGRLIPGFDLNNSPAHMATANVHERLLIQRTGAGTQGAVSAYNASHILLCALTNAQATATYARTLSTSTGGIITLLPTATLPEAVEKNEDDLCADYVEALLQERDDAADILQKSIDYLRNSNRFGQWKDDPDFPAADVSIVLDANRFNFAMPGQPREWQGVRYIEARRVDP